MATEPIRWREPEVFTAGDSLIFQRNLPDYLPGDGWYIQGTLTLPQASGGNVVAQYTSAADSSGLYHLVNVPNFAAALDAGTYILSEEIICSHTGAFPDEKHQIYFSDNFVLGPNLASGIGTAVQQTQAQQMLAVLFSTLLDLAKQKYQETDVQRNRFLLAKSADVLRDFKFWTAKRNEEIAIERVRNGRNPGNTQEAVFNIG